MKLPFTFCLINQTYNCLRVIQKSSRANGHFRNWALAQLLKLFINSFQDKFWTTMTIINIKGWITEQFNECLAIPLLSGDPAAQKNIEQRKLFNFFILGTL